LYLKVAERLNCGKMKQGKPASGVNSWNKGLLAIIQNYAHISEEALHISDFFEGCSKVAATLK
jgi:hypothetical protein